MSGRRKVETRPTIAELEGCLNLGEQVDIEPDGTIKVGDAAVETFAWYQHVGWYESMHPFDVQDKLRESQAAYDVNGGAGWVVVPGYLVRDYFALEMQASEAEVPADYVDEKTAAGLVSDDDTTNLAREILLDLVRTKGPSTEWPKLAWKMAREFAAEGEAR